jgi:dipeptidyl aminopeptidase/acylaminoacyl peptidase
MEASGQYDISPDGKEVAYGGILFDESRSLIRTVVFTVPTAGGSPTALTMDHPADDMRPRYTPDGTAIVYGMQHDPFFYADRVRLMRYDRAARTHAALLDDWDLTPTHWEFAADGTLCFEAEENGRVCGFVLGRGDKAPRRVITGGSISGLAPAAGGRLFFTLQNISQPPELYAVVDAGTGAEPADEVHRGRDGQGVARRSARDSVRRRLRRDGADVRRAAAGISGGKKYPLIQVVHGGPHGISADSFHFRWNAQSFAAPATSPRW